MWCSQCQADVATEISADGNRLLCTICGEEVRKVFAPSQHPETQSARELLERWSKSDILKSISTLKIDEDGFQNAPADDEDEVAAVAEEVTVPTAAIAPSPVAVKPPEPPAPVVSVPPRPVVAAPIVLLPPIQSLDDDDEDSGADLLPSPRTQEAPAARPIRKIHRGGRPPLKREHMASAPAADVESVVRNWRVDAGHAETYTRPVAPPVSKTYSEAPAHRAEATTIPMAGRRDDRAHEAAPAPHFDLEPFSTGKKPGRHESIFGQLLAYLGVGLLTVGTVLVVWGYFGGPAVARYQSTGWLISTAGQMLLFLGVVTLVSGGMQQTTHEVAQRVEHLGDRMLRIEQSTQELLRGPYFAKESAAQREQARRDDVESA